MDKQISADEFIRHTKNMIELAKEQNNTTVEVFLTSVLSYFEEYLSEFCN